MVEIPRPSLPTRQADAPSNSTSAEAFERLPSLSFSRSSRIAFVDAVGKDARHEETGEPLPACASTRKASDIGAEKNHLWPVMR